MASGGGRGDPCLLTRSKWRVLSSPFHRHETAMGRDRDRDRDIGLW